MARKKSGQRTAKAIPNAPLYIIGPTTIEWSHDMENFYSVTMQGSESFGEYASICFAKRQGG